MGLLLALDVGNTNTVLGFFEADALVATARLTTVRERTSDEHALSLRAVIEGKGRKVGEVDDVIVSSVVPPQDFPIRAACRDAFGIDPLFVAPGVKTGMKILYDQPSEVGADRIVNAVAAVARYGAPCIVVDFGTATTFDIVNAQGEYAGGIISPGILISAEALFAHASRLYRVDVRAPEQLIGRNTAAAMQAGIFFGYVGLVDGILARLQAEIPDLAAIVATGGQAEMIASGSRFIREVEPQLTLIGLRLIHALNRG